jgi:hypothetical protein
VKVKELIKKLRTYNQDAEVSVIAMNKEFEFSLVYGDSDGVTKEQCDSVSFYVDELCAGEQQGGC